MSSSDITVNSSITIESCHYELYACVCHHGFSSKSGHYTAYCQHESGRWWHCNDEKVRDVTDSFSVASTLKDAYVLFYRQQQQQQPAFDSISERSTGSSNSASSYSYTSGSSGVNSIASSKYSSRL